MRGGGGRWVWTDFRDAFILHAMNAGGAAEPPTVGPPRPGIQMLAIAATVLLALVAGTVVATVLLNGRTPQPGVGEATPSPTATLTATVEPPASGPSATSSLVPYLAEDVLLQVSVEGLRMRATASNGADVVRTLDYGEVVRVMSGPVEADGYAWYEVLDLDSRSGWVAMGGGGEPWLEVVPRDAATSELLLRFQRDGDVTPREQGGIPVWPPDLTLTADGRVVVWSGGGSFGQGVDLLVVRHLSPSGLAQVQRDVLQLPALQASAAYVLEHRPGAPEAPGHGVGLHTFTLGEGTGRVDVTAVSWQYEEEAAYWMPAPERQALDALAIHLLDVEAWLGPAAWSEPVARPYVSSSYLFWLSAPSDTPPEGDYPSVTGAAWPFDGPIEQFGEPVGQARCGYVDLGQAFEMLRLMRQRGVPTYPFGVDAPHLSLDGFGSGNLATDAGWFNFWLTPRSPDGYPACTADS
jgi:hypothetical protein